MWISLQLRTRQTYVSVEIALESSKESKCPPTREALVESVTVHLGVGDSSAVTFPYVDEERCNITGAPPSHYSIVCTVWSHLCEKMIYAFFLKSVRIQPDSLQWLLLKKMGVIWGWGGYFLSLGFWKVWTFTMIMCYFLKLIFNIGDICSKKFKYKKILRQISLLSTPVLPRKPLLPVSHIAFGGILCLSKHSHTYSFFSP